MGGEYGPLELFASILAGIMFMAFALGKLVNRFKWPAWANGSSDHPTEKARLSAKLDTLIEVSRHNGKISGDLLIAQRDTMREQRKMRDALTAVCNWREVDVERHTNTVKQLDRIESGVTELKNRE